MQAAWGVYGLPKSRTDGHGDAARRPRREAQGVYIIGENPMISDPDLNHVEKSLKHSSSWWCRTSS